MIESLRLFQEAVEAFHIIQGGQRDAVISLSRCLNFSAQGLDLGWM